jgi:hypothetical protein
MCDFTNDNEENWAALRWCLQDMEWSYDGTLQKIKESVVHECKASCMEDRSDWHYWKMPCGHIYHTRCLEMHLYKKQKLNCCLCGDLTPTKWYCDFCKEDGHYKYRFGRDINCFLSDTRDDIVKKYEEKGIEYAVKWCSHLYISKNECYRVIRIYKRLIKGDKFDWRKELGWTSSYFTNTS